MENGLDLKRGWVTEDSRKEYEVVIGGVGRMIAPKRKWTQGAGRERACHCHFRRVNRVNGYEWFQTLNQET